MPGGGGEFKSPSDTLVSTRIRSGGGLNASVVVVDDGEVEFVVDGFAVFGFGVGHDALELASALVVPRSLHASPISS